MGKRKLVRSHVERCLQDVYDVCRIEVDRDGDYVLPSKPARGYVRVVSWDETLIRVFFPVVCGAPTNAKLLRELHDINNRLLWGRIVRRGHDIELEQMLEASTLSRKQLGQVCKGLAGVAAQVGPMIAAVHGGECLVELSQEPASGG